MSLANRTRMALANRLPELTRFPQRSDVPSFELTFFCHGHAYKCLARGRNTEAAAAEGLIALAAECPDFDSEAARLIACVQVR